jgi:hypothetical protein
MSPNTLVDKARLIAERVLQGLPPQAGKVYPILQYHAIRFFRIKISNHLPPPSSLLSAVLVPVRRLTRWIVIASKEQLLCAYCYSLDLSTRMTTSAIHVLSTGYCLSGRECSCCKPLLPPSLSTPFFFFQMGS